MEKLSFAKRVRMSFEELGPTFIKLGQLLSGRPDLIPQELCDELKKLHNQVLPISFDKVQQVLESHFKKDINEVFNLIEENPLASASVAQVHRAALLSGDKVVVKVQKLGAAETIKKDVSVLRTLSRLIEKYLPELRVYNLTGIVDEIERVLELETDFIVEGNNIRRFQENFEDDENLVIPKVYPELSGRLVLVMEEIQGIPLSQENALLQENVNPEELLKVGLTIYLKMVFKHGVFHGDLHPGNMFVLPNNKIGLVDFGSIGHLTKKHKRVVSNIFIALSSEDYERLAYEFIDLSPYNASIDIDAFARELRHLLAPYHGLTLKDVSLGKLLLQATNLAFRHKLTFPPDLALYFRSLISIEGMGHRIMPKFDLLSYSQGMVEEVYQYQSNPKELAQQWILFLRDSNALLSFLPRQLKQFMRKMNSPESSFKISLLELEHFSKTVKKSANLLFLGVIIGSLILGGSLLLSLRPQENDLSFSYWGILIYLFSLFLGLVAFRIYTKK